MTSPDQLRDHTATVVLAATAGLTGLGALFDTVAAATGHPIVVGLTAAVVAVLVGVVRWMTRRARERREDAADTLEGAAWRIEHMPHLAARIDTAQPDRDSAGVA